MIKFNKILINRFTALLLTSLIVTGCSAEVSQDQISSDSIAGSEVSENQTEDQPEEQPEDQPDTLSENAGQSVSSASGQAQNLSQNEAQEEDEGTYDTMEEREIVCENPYFFPRNVSSLTADITFCDLEAFATIRGDLELHWLKQYENGCVAKLSLLPFANMPEYLLNGSIWAEGEYEYCDIYFYVTSDEIYRINSYVIQDGEYVYAYDDENLFINLLDSDEKIIENAELVCCPEGLESEYTGDNIGDDFITGEIGTHYEIVVSENQITYCRQEYPAGHMEFYNSMVWENGRGLTEFRRGYRAGAVILYLENITVNHGNILKCPGKACKINGFMEKEGAYCTTTTPFLKEP